MKILRGLILAGSMTALVAGFSACGGTVCDDAADIITGCLPADSTADGSSDGEEAECTGQAECAANCTVNNESAVCAFFDDPTVTDNAYVTCLADCI